jgi:hypothetical protein
MRAESTEGDACGGQQRAQGDEKLRAQDAFFGFFTRCGRTLP